MDGGCCRKDGGGRSISTRRSHANDPNVRESEGNDNGEDRFREMKRYDTDT